MVVSANCHGLLDEEVDLSKQDDQESYLIRQS